MDLIIDVGNSRAKLAWFRGEWLVRQVHIPSEDAAAIRQAAKQEPVKAIAVGSVGQDAQRLVQELDALAPTLLITSATPAPLRSEYSTQGTLGADRWANAVAGHALFPTRGVLVVDAGTCITYDLVRHDGRYAGGAISPGLGLRAKAMHEHSARLPLVEVEDGWPALFAASTRDSLRSGVVHGAIHECQGFIAAFRKEWPDGAVLVTGGDGLRLGCGLKSGIFAHPYLTLEGYRRILDHHRAGLGPA